MTGVAIHPPPATRLATTGERLTAAIVSAACLGVLIVAATITPDAHGHGTHTRLGLPPCGWAVVMGKPCPTCGMTTAFAHAVRVEVGRAIVAQPMGALLAVLASATFWVALHTVATGSMLAHAAVATLRPRVLWTLAALGAVAWAYKWITWEGM